MVERLTHLKGKKLNSNDERKRLYKLVRDAGFSCGVATRLRDWTPSHVSLFIDNNKPFIADSQMLSRKKP